MSTSSCSIRDSQWMRWIIWSDLSADEIILPEQTGKLNHLNLKSQRSLLRAAIRGNSLGRTCLWLFDFTDICLRKEKIV